jgi:hypothetical protein
VSLEFVPSLGCQAFQDRLLCASFLLALAGSVTACLLAIEWVAYFFRVGSGVRGSTERSQKELTDE